MYFKCGSKFSIVIVIFMLIVNIFNNQIRYSLVFFFRACYEHHTLSIKWVWNAEIFFKDCIRDHP